MKWGKEEKKDKQQLLNPSEEVNVQKKEGITDKERNKENEERRGKGKAIKKEASLLQFQAAVEISNTGRSTNASTFKLCFMVFGMMNPQQNQSPLDLFVQFSSFYVDAEFCWLDCNWGRDLWLKLKKNNSRKSFTLFQFHLRHTVFGTADIAQGHFSSLPEILLNQTLPHSELTSWPATHDKTLRRCVLLWLERQTLEPHRFQFCLRFIACHLLATAGWEVSLTRRALMGVELEREGEEENILYSGKKRRVWVRWGSSTIL